MARKADDRTSERKRRGRGEGSIFQRKDGTWCSSFSAGYGTDGKRRRRDVYGKTKKEVQDKLRDAQQSGFTETSRMTISQFLDHWLESAVKPSLARATYARYKIVLDQHVKQHIGWMRVTKLEPVHVQQLYAEQAKAGASLRNQELSGVVLGKALKAAVKLRLLTSNPARDVDKPRPERKEMQVWTKSQVDLFLEAVKNDRLYALWVLAIASGMREGELFGLEWSDIDFAGSAVTVQRTLEDIAGVARVKEPKTKKSSRRIDLPQFAVDALHEHRKKMLAEARLDRPVFCDHDGGYLRRQNVKRRNFDKRIDEYNNAARKEAEERGSQPVLLPHIRIHDLRHTAATLLLLEGVNPKVVSERLGHASVVITLDIYSHVLPSMGKGAADKLDRLFG